MNKFHFEVTISYRAILFTGLAVAAYKILSA